MSRRLLLALALAALVLLPAPAHAAPARASSPHAGTQCTFPTNVVVRVGQSLREALGLDTNIYDSVQVPVDGQILTIWICAPQAEAARARTMLDLMAHALPLLAHHAGLRLYGDTTRYVLVDPTADMLDQGLDGYHEARTDIIHIHPRSEDWTVIHEAAHYWANRRTMAELWLREGYAEYLTELVVADLRRPDRSTWDDAGCEDARLLPDNQAPVNCPYRLGARVFREIDRIAGGTVLRDTLQQLSTGMARVDSRRLMVALEAGGHDVYALFARHVLPESDPIAVAWGRIHQPLRQTLIHSRALNAPLPEAVARAVERWRAGTLELTDIRAVQPWLAPLAEMFGQARVAALTCGQLRLTCLTPWLEPNESPEGVAERAAQLRAANEILLPAYRGLSEEAAAAGFAMPQWLSDAAAGLDAAQAPPIAQARAVLRSGMALKKRCTPLGLTCARDWPEDWMRGDLRAAAARIAAAGPVLDGAASLEAQCGDLRASCRSLWVTAYTTQGDQGAAATIAALREVLRQADDIRAACGAQADSCHTLWAGPLRKGDLAGAAAAQRSLQQQLRRARVIVASCGAAADACRASFHAALASGDLAAIARRAGELEELANRGRRLADACTLAGEACDGVWGEALRESVEAANARVTELEQRLAHLEAIRLRAGDDPMVAAAAWLLASGPAEHAQQVHQRIARGDISAIDAVHQTAERVRQLAHTLWIATGVAAALLAGALVGFAWRRIQRRRRARASSERLLADLLSRPPGR
jgi:hypothetical protein